MAEPAVSTYSYEAYLALEADSELKYEYHDGFIVAMAGGSPEHGQLAVNFTRFLGNLLDKQNRSCKLFSSDVKVHIAATNRNFYPDASMVCGPDQRSEKDPRALTNPSLILEILSDSTEAKDRGLKFRHYRQLPSLREYVLISQTEAAVDTYYRTDAGTWEIESILGLDQSVLLKSIGGSIALADIYRNVDGLAEGE